MKKILLAALLASFAMAGPVWAQASTQVLVTSTTAPQTVTATTDATSSAIASAASSATAPASGTASQTKAD